MNDLKLKVEKLVNLHERLKAERDQLVLNQKQLEDELRGKEEEIEELKEKNRLVKLAQAVSESDQNTRDIKIKINEYVREIDRCIALINR
jgi:uncharacterized protein YoxC